MLTSTLENIRSTAYTGIIITDSPAPEKIEDYPCRQVFYKVRSAIAASQSIDKTAIRPDSKLITFFPRRNRQQRIRAFQYELGVEVGLLVIKDSLEWTIILSTVASFAMLFFSWQAMIAGFAFTALLAWLSARFGQKLEFDTVRQLVEKVAREHY